MSHVDEGKCNVKNKRKRIYLIEYGIHINQRYNEQ